MMRVRAKRAPGTNFRTCGHGGCTSFATFVLIAGDEPQCFCCGQCATEGIRAGTPDGFIPPPRREPSQSLRIFVRAAIRKLEREGLLRPAEVSVCLDPANPKRLIAAVKMSPPFLGMTAQAKGKR